MTKRETTRLMLGRRFTTPTAANDNVEWIPYADLPAWLGRWILMGARDLFRSREAEIEAKRVEGCVLPIVRFDSIAPAKHPANRNLVLLPPGWTRGDFYFWLNARRQLLRRRESADFRLKHQPEHRNEWAKLDALERWAEHQFRRREG